MILIVSLSLAVGTEPHQIRSTETYALSDNRIIAYKGEFCQDLRTSSTSIPMNQQSVGYLYFLRSRPPLTEHETFTASGTANLNSMNFHYWNFYLNTGSEASFTVCYQQDVRNREVIFYIIRGTKQLNEWIEEPRDRNVEESYRLTSDCETIDYEVRGDGMYYFVFYLSGDSFSALDVDFVIDRILYDIQPDNILHECSFALDGTSSCVLSVGMNSGYTAALSFNASRPIDYADDGAEIRISCQPRAWLYAVIVVVVFIVGTLIFICGIAVCVKIALIAINKSSSSRSRVTNAVIDGGTTTSTIESSFTKPSSTVPADYPRQPPPEYPRPPPYSAS